MSCKRRISAADVFLIAGIILPIVAGVLLKVLLLPAGEGLQITGAYIFFTIPFPLGNITITESQVNSWLVMISIFFACLFLTHGLKERPVSKRQLVAEWIVEKVDKLVISNMGEYFRGFSPFVCAILALSAFSSLLSLFGLYPPTSDLNVVAGWAIMVFLLITYYKMKCGPLGYLKSFTQPVGLLLPLNLISEVATPLSMAFRHYGNIISGSLISVLVKAALGGLSTLLLGWLPGILGDFPLFEIGLPAVLSIYFDVFSGCLQAFIFAMLTMLYVAGAFPAEDYAARKEKRRLKKLAKNN